MEEIERLKALVEKLQNFEQETKEYALKNKDLTKSLLDMKIKHDYEISDLTSALTEMNSKYLFDTQRLQNEIDEAQNKLEE